MTIASAVISVSPTVEKDVVAKIKATLPASMRVREEIYLQFTAGAAIEVIQIGFVFGSSQVGTGFLQELGKEAYRRLKDAVKRAFSKGRERIKSGDLRSFSFGAPLSY